MNLSQHSTLQEDHSRQVTQAVILLNQHGVFQKIIYPCQENLTQNSYSASTHLIQGSSLKDVLATQVFEQHLEKIQIVTSTNTPGSLRFCIGSNRPEFLFRHKDSQAYEAPESFPPRWYESQILPYLQDQVLWVLNDITGVVAGENRSRALLKAIPDMIFWINASGEITDYSSQASDDLIVPPEKVIGTHIEEIFSTEVCRQIHNAMERVTTAEKAETVLFIASSVNGQQPATFEARLSLSDSQEIIAVVRNVTDQKNLEQMKSDFINRATHELRTPLTTISLMVDLIEKVKDSSKKSRYWEILKSELKHERLLVEDLLTVGRIERDSFELQLKWVMPLPILHEVIESQANYAQDKQIHIGFTSNIFSEIVVLGDEQALHQVFTNLINNAIKFTPKGKEIFVKADLQPGQVCFIIEDQGIGIPEQDIPHIFTRFYRAQNAFENGIPGSGIGLFIVKSIIEKMKGKIQVSSHLGQGTRFEIFLPV